MIKVKLYGTAMEFKSQKHAMAYFSNAIASSEGAEQDRYAYCLVEIMNGETDIDSDNY